MKITALSPEKKWMKQTNRPELFTHGRLDLTGHTETMFQTFLLLLLLLLVLSISIKPQVSSCFSSLFFAFMLILSCFIVKKGRKKEKMCYHNLKSSWYQYTMEKLCYFYCTFLFSTPVSMTMNLIVNALLRQRWRNVWIFNGRAT